MSAAPPSPSAFRVADLRANGEHVFDLAPSKDALAQLAEDLDLSAIKKLTFSGALNPLGKSDWRLKGKLGATIVQPCVVTLEPVTTRIDTAVERMFIADFQDPEGEEVEMTDEDTIEPLGAWIDPAQVMQEALVLAAPDYPRLPGAEAGAQVFTKPGEAPMTGEDAKPFAGLADLKALLEDGDS